VSQCPKPVIPDEPTVDRRDPWFGGLTTLSNVEGESRKTDDIDTLWIPARVPRSGDLAGMTDYDIALEGERGFSQFETRRCLSFPGRSKVMIKASSLVSV
jgi:hypothetical protein